ncbi:membrane protein insertion efficiency factor YidD [Belliella sp. DSM 107340]|uniref:Membrane protein insertion efficiency factor YidD n=1 Tax=Belliella calami TaxID=2923436 RepID=A0ABS9UQN2_9BACT|nr:membrane protein insertion efficiency factor YidD [Belliella calami]MCH7398927.1 membrane protein insertion efficiency factor YidD [Belliella calami]
MSKKIIFFLSFFFVLNFSYSQDESPGDMYNFYQKFISDIRSQSCPMYPSCSKYSMQAFREKGFGQGLIMTSDRLMRCGHEHKLYDLTISTEDYKLVDLVEDPENKVLIKKEIEFSKKFQTKAVNDTVRFFLHLIDNNLYQESIIEYNRIKFFDPSLDLTLEYNYFKALMSLEEYEKIIFEYDNLVGTELENNPHILLKLSEAWYNLNQPEKALQVLEKEMDWEELSDRRYAFRGYIYAQLEDFDQVKTNYSMVSEAYLYREYLTKNLQTIESMSNLKEKKPVVAGLLGIIPGAGYVYSGHTTTGISSLVLNGLLGYATYTSFKTENYGIGILTGMFSTAFYIGNISGGYKAAKRYNKNQKNNQRKKLMYSFN